MLAKRPESNVWEEVILRDNPPFQCATFPNLYRGIVDDNFPEYMIEFKIPIKIQK